MSITLPNDVLIIIVAQLRDEFDFATLYQFSRCSKQFSAHALPTLYRIGYNAPIVMDTGREDAGGAPRLKAYAQMWRSIFLSTISGKTLFQYARWMRVLRLQELVEFLKDLNNRKQEGVNWLADDEDIQQVVKLKTSSEIDVVQTLRTAGDAITQHSIQLEELGGPLTSEMLISWVPRLQELTSLTLEHGNVLSKVPPEILQHLKGLRELFIFHWAEPGLPLGNADKDFANFLVNYGGSLQSLDVTADGVIGPHTIRALKYHGKTLVSLKIPSWAPEDTLFLNSEVGSMPRLSSVQLPYPKTNDAAIDLTVTTPTFATTQQVEDEVARWLASCQNLASIKLQDWPNALKILKVIAGEPGINLRRIEIQGTVENPGFDIYKLLNSITSLRELVLGFSSDWDGGYKPSKLSGLGNLRVLDLPYLSEGLEDGDICTLPDFHKHLEKLSIGCTLATDEIWKSLVKMKRLRTIAITGFSQFTKRGILGWLKSVQDIEKGPVQLEILASTGNGLPTGGPALGKLKTPFLKEKGSMLEIQAADDGESDYSELED